MVLGCSRQGMAVIGILLSLQSFSAPINVSAFALVLRHVAECRALQGSVEFPDGGAPERMSPEEDAATQWGLFKKHHALGSWRGTWNTYDHMGDVLDSTIAAVDLDLDETGTSASQVHQFVSEQVQSDCDTCFDAANVKSMPVSQYSLGNLGRSRLASVGMCIGPRILRSGAMSTELVLRHGDGRVRVIFQHAPVWEAGVEPGSCPPQGLKMFRALVSKEALRPGPPTFEAEEKEPPAPGNPKFFRGVPPFQWHKRWSGTSWTWGPSTGDRGWSIEEMEEADAWHGRPRGDGAGVWSMRLPGILIQCPRVIVNEEAGICRLAWLPEDDTDNAKLLRVEASVLALEPIIDDDDENIMVGFYPPSLGSLRCDTMEKLGELEDASQLQRLMEIDSASGSGEGVIRPGDETAAPPPAAPPAPGTEKADGKKLPAKKIRKIKKGEDNDDDSGLEAIRGALNL